jgi:hypothetical protein
MRNHTKIYFEYFGIDYDQASGSHDHIDCEMPDCRKSAVDIHHIESRGMGGSLNADRIQNLMALCRLCHEKHGDVSEMKNELIRIHDQKLSEQ